MAFEKTGVHTDVAFHTVIEIHSCTNIPFAKGLWSRGRTQSFASTADVAERTVVDVFVGVVVVQPADGTVIPCHDDVTATALICDALFDAAGHTDDLFHTVSIQFVILFGIVAQTADVDLTATGSHQGTVSLVMGASEHSVRFRGITHKVRAFWSGTVT